MIQVQREGALLLEKGQGGLQHRAGVRHHAGDGAESQEKVFPSGKTLEVIIRELTLAWHQHKHGGNKPEATSVSAGKPNIDLVCFLKLGPALLGGKNDVNFMHDAAHLHKAMDAQDCTRMTQRANKKQRVDQDHQDRVGTQLAGSRAASGMQLLHQIPGLVDSMRAVNISTAITSRMEERSHLYRYTNLGSPHHRHQPTVNLEALKDSTSIPYGARSTVDWLQIQCQ